MQKLVTIYLESYAYMSGQWINRPVVDKHRYVEEHLQPDLQSGWRVVSLVALGGADVLSARGWLAVLLEKPDD